MRHIQINFTRKNLILQKITIEYKISKIYKHATNMLFTIYQYGIVKRSKRIWEKW